jgi:hypothetical protein
MIDSGATRRPLLESRSAEARAEVQPLDGCRGLPSVVSSWRGQISEPRNVAGDASRGTAMQGAERRWAGVATET